MGGDGDGVAGEELVLTLHTVVAVTVVVVRGSWRAGGQGPMRDGQRVLWQLLPRQVTRAPAPPAPD